MFWKNIFGKKTPINLHSEPRKIKDRQNHRKAPIVFPFADAGGMVRTVILGRTSHPFQPTLACVTPSTSRDHPEVCPRRVSGLSCYVERLLLLLCLISEGSPWCFLSRLGCCEIFLGLTKCLERGAKGPDVTYLLLGSLGLVFVM